MNELEALAEKEQQEKKQREETQQALRAQMMGLEQQSVTTDDAQRTAYREKALSYQRNYEASLVQDMNAQAQRAEIRQGPPDGDHPIGAPAAKESWKEKRDHVNREKKAAAELKDLNTMSGAIMTPEIIAAANARGMDVRVIAGFGEFCRLDSRGRPATPADEEILHRNRTRLMDYVTGSEAQRNAQLDEMTNKVLGMELTPHMLDDERYVLENAARIKSMSLQLTSFESVMEDNRAYFDRLDPQVRQAIMDKIDLMGSFGTTMTDTFRANSVQDARGKYTGDEDDAEANRAEARENLKEHRDLFRRECTDYLLKREYAQLRTGEEIARDKAQKLEKFGAYFENGATDIQYDELKKARELIAANPEAYAANKELVDHFYQAFYRTLEASGEAAVKGLGYASIALAHRRDADANGRALYERADEISEKRGAELQQLAQYGGCLSDILRATLRGEPMTAEGQKILADYQEERRAAAEAAAQKAEQERLSRIAAEKKAEENEKRSFEQERIAGAQTLAAERETQEKTARRERGNALKKLQVFGGTETEKKTHRAHVAAFERLQGKAAEEAPGDEIVPNTVKWRLPKDWQQSAQAGVDYLVSLKTCANLSVPEDFKNNAALKTEKRSPFYLKDFKLNEQGKPATKVDEDILAANRQRCRDYATGDPALRKPLLDELVNQFKHVDIRPDEFDQPEKIVKELSYYNSIVRLHLGILALREENPEYFAAMDPALRDELQKKNDFFINIQLVKLYGAAAGMAGLDVRTRKVLDEDSMAVYKDVYNETVGLARQKLSAYDTEQQANGLYRERRANYASTDEARRKRSGTSFPGGAGTEQYQEILTARHLIAAHPEQYAQNRELIDEMFKRLYAGNAMLGENEFRIRANQDLIDGKVSVRDDGVQPETRARCAAESIEKLKREQNRLRDYNAGITALFGSLLENREMTEPAAMTLAAYNVERRTAEHRA